MGNDTFQRKDIIQDSLMISSADIPKTMTFHGEFYFELIDVDGAKLEHVWFRSQDESFEKMMDNLPELMKLPQSAKITVEIL